MATNILEHGLDNIRGIGKKRAEGLQKLGLNTVRDMLFYLPRDYQNFSESVPVSALTEGICCAELRIHAEPRVAHPRRGLSIVSATGVDGTGKVNIVWFNQPYRKKQVQIGAGYFVYGRVRMKGKTATFENPDIEPIANAEGGSSRTLGILPTYSLTAGIGQKVMRTMARVCVDLAQGHLTETLPEAIREQYRLCEINYAVSQAHFPDDMQTLAAARRRLGMEEVIYLMLAVEWMKQCRQEARGVAFQTDGLLAEFLEKLPFAPTDAQRRVLADIEKDMCSPAQMNRMVQGDVGAGKTILALYALYIAQKNGYQGALMAPTELLARQHAENARRIFGDQIQIDLLVGSLTPRQKKEIHERLAAGTTDIAIGTHALIQEAVQFQKLGVVIADEQHRFGVRQRGALSQGNQADTLIMSATPIPRTMTMILYGDLDVSVLNGLPPGRKPVQTRLVPPAKSAALYDYVAAHAREGKQSYVVGALIEPDEEGALRSVTEIAEELKKGSLRGISVGLLHGRMRAQEKEAILEAFRAGEVMVLVATTVIEVGVDVPNACIMVIEDADRFGLAQLHQLRGRVGRGHTQSWCFLRTNADKAETMERLQTLCDSQDGFEIAQRDLELRGPGEFLGTRQSGSRENTLLHLVDNMEMLEQAQKIAQHVLKKAADDPETQALWEAVRNTYGTRWAEIALN